MRVFASKNSRKAKLLRYLRKISLYSGKPISHSGRKIASYSKFTRPQTNLRVYESAILITRLPEASIFVLDATDSPNSFNSYTSAFVSCGGIEYTVY